MLHVVKGDLLASDCDVLVHQANCFTTMGSGIAKQIRATYPAVYQADVEYKFPSGDRERLGRYSYAVVEGKLIVNLYSQYMYGHSGGRYTDYDAMEQGLTKLFKVLQKKDRPFKVGLPYGIGCGLGGGDWKMVSALLKDVSDKFGIDIYLYKL